MSPATHCNRSDSTQRPAVRLAVVSHTLPPDGNGQAVALGRLLAGLDADDCLLVTLTKPLSADFTTSPRRLPLRHVVHAPIDRPATARGGIVGKGATIARAVRKGIDAARNLAQTVRREGCDAVVSTSGEWYELPAAWWAARSARLPYVVYMFDWYAHKYHFLDGWTGRLIRRFARLVEGPILRRAAAVIVPNDALADEYRRRYGVESRVIYNATDFAPADTEPPPLSTRSHLTIRYTGAVYEAQADALATFAAGLGRMQAPTASLEMYTDADPGHLRELGIVGPAAVRPRVAPAAADALQKSAELLLLPLAFRSRYPELVRTSCPAKLADYLASGRPTVVHAPADSFVAQYCRRRECAVVIDRPEAEAVAREVSALAADDDRQRRLVVNALRAAREDFAIDRARRAFFDVFQGPQFFRRTPVTSRAASNAQTAPRAA